MQDDEVDAGRDDTQVPGKIKKAIRALAEIVDLPTASAHSLHDLPGQRFSLPYESKGMDPFAIPLDPSPNHAREPSHGLDEGCDVKDAPGTAPVGRSARHGSVPKGALSDLGNNFLEFPAREKSAVVIRSLGASDFAAGCCVGVVACLCESHGLTQQLAKERIALPEPT
jgi:hypothetical protein